MRNTRFPAFALALFAMGSAAIGCSGPTNTAATPATAQSTLRMPPPRFTAVEFTNGITGNSTPRGITAGPGGDMFFTQPGSDQIGRISPAGVVTEFAAPKSGANNIVKGPDNNLWFTTGADSVAKMTPKGALKEFSVGNEAYGPFDITRGSDGALWFTFRSPSTNAIGRITTSGSATLYTSGLSPGDVAVHDVTTGPDGNVWFTEEFGNRIGRITPSGTITEFSNGITTGAGLVDIAPGPDGNLWFTENSANQIGRITPSGVVTEFSNGISPAAGPGSIFNFNGYLWFTETGYSQIGRVSTSGSITEYPIPASLASDIAFSGRYLWITDFTGNGIVRVKP